MIIYKYDIEVETKIPLPIGAKVIHLGIQAGVLRIWVERDAPREGEVLQERTFRIIGTGHEFVKQGAHIGTVFDGPWVWHVYESI